MNRVPLFGIELDAVRMDQAVSAIYRMIDEDAICRFVVTPNVDHVLLLQRTEPMRRAYAEASLIIADGLPVVLASRLFGRPLPERVPGSDLVPAVFRAARPERPLRVFLLGAGPGVAVRAAQNVETTFPSVRVVGTYSPPMGFERDSAQNEAIIEQVRAAAPDVLVVGLGAPKQELWTFEHRERLRAKVALCVGATIDFLAGAKPRAPEWMQRTGLEWFHRMISEPKRLVPRYTQNAIEFPKLLVKEWRAHKSPRIGV